MPRIGTDELLGGLRRAGLRVTAPRRSICDALAAHHDEHLTASDLHALAQKRSGRRIDPSTVYRTIEALQTVGEIHHVHLGHGAAIIHLSDHSDHHHLVCETCGRTEDVPIDELVRLTDHLEDRYQFVADGVHFAVVGRCTSHRNDR